MFTAGQFRTAITKEESSMSKVEGNDDDRIQGFEHNLMIFTFDELRRATRNFRPSAILGVSNGDSVYKGWVDSSSYTPSIPGVGISVAIKISNTDNVQCVKGWQAEVSRGKFRHPNLVKLLGYCSEDKMLCLVYENIPKQNLVNILRRHPLEWGTAMKIAIGAAQGLAFLHNAEGTPINRTFSASSVLLNEDFEARLYFGSASLVRAHGVLPVVMSYAVTSRYTPPEYLTTSHWYIESDIYAFGVMMLDMISGSHFLDDYSCTSSHSLIEWVRPILTNKTELQRIMDPWLEQGNPPKGVHKAVELILSCLNDDPKKRPSMKEVLASLEGIKAC